MITFTGIVFSAVFVAAQIQTSSYSPRLAARLRRDPVVIAGLALPDRHRQLRPGRARRDRAPDQRVGGDFVPAVTVLFGLVLAAVTLGAFVALVQRAFESTQIGGILRTLMRRAYAVIDDVHPRDAPAEDAVRRRRPTPARARSRTPGRRPSSPRSTARRCCASPSRPAGSWTSSRSWASTSPRAGSSCASAARRDDAEPGSSGASSCSPASGRWIRTRRSCCGCSSTSRSARCRRRSTTRPPPCRCSTGSRRCSSSSPAGIPGRRSSSTTTAGPARACRAPRWSAYVELGLIEIRRYGAGLAAGRAPADGALRPPGRGRERRRARPRRPRAPAARRSGRRRVPRRRGTPDRGGGRLGLG